jgi:hypothetical protein
LQRRQDDRTYQLQLLQLLTSAISTRTLPSSVSPVERLPVVNQSPHIDKVPLQQQENKTTTRAEKRKCSSKLSNEKKNKLRQSLPTNFYSLMARIHDVNHVNGSS